MAWSTFVKIPFMNHTPDPSYFDKRVAHFFQLRLPVEFWTHEAHLGVAFWLLSVEPTVEKALPIMRNSISAYNESVGTANTTSGGYHETLTRFWLEALAAYRKAHPVLHAETNFNNFLRTEAAHGKLPWKWYSQEYLMSVDARMQWAAPDLQPLESLESFMKNPRQIHHGLSNEAFETAFANGTFPPSWFTHEAHLRLAWWHIRKYGVTQAEENIHAQILNLVRQYQLEHKYHSTITHASVQVVHHFMKVQDAQDFETFIQLHPKLLDNFQGLLTTHYSPEVLNSKEAQLHVLPPDLLSFSDQ